MDKQGQMDKDVLETDDGSHKQFTPCNGRINTAAIFHCVNLHSKESISSWLERELTVLETIKCS